MPQTVNLQTSLESAKSRDSAYPRLLQGLAFMAFWVALLFASAGRIRWLRGWIWAVAYALTMLAVGFVVHRRNPTLIPARSKWNRPGTKTFDSVILAIYLPLTIAQPAVAGLDVVRFHWSSMPFWTLYPALALFFCSVALIAWPLVVNPWAESSVRIQSDRGQQVVRSGPYRFVRHPMYVGMILMCISVALTLGSLWALVLAAVMAALLILRTALEDRTLQRELPGYQDFAAVTRWRLIPFVW